MIHGQVFADLGKQTAPVATGAAPLLARAFEAVHVGCRTAHVLKHPLKTGVVAETARFIEQRFRAAPLDGTSLVHGDGTETAFAIAATMRRQ